MRTDYGTPKDGHMNLSVDQRINPSAEGAIRIVRTRFRRRIECCAEIDLSGLSEKYFASSQNVV